MRKAWLLALGFGAIAAPALAGPLEKALDCARHGQHDCAFQAFLSYYQSEDANVIDPNELAHSIESATFEASFMGLADTLEPAEQRRAAEDLLALLEAEGTPLTKMRTGPHLIRVEACNTLEDYDCAIESARYICENQDELTLPVAPEGMKEAVMDRVFRVLGICDKVSQ